MHTSRCSTRIYFRVSFFLIYINDLATDLKSNVELIAGDTCLFSIVSDPLETASILNKDLDKIQTGLNSGKWLLIQTQQNKLKKSFFQKASGIFDLREHKFRHNFQTLLIRCVLAVQQKQNRLPIFPKTSPPHKSNLLNELHKLDSNILNLDEISLTKFLLYGDSKYENKANKTTLLVSINFVLSTKRFGDQLMCVFLKYMSACNFSCLLLVYILRFMLLFYALLHRHRKVMRSCFQFVIVLLLFQFYYC